MLTRVDRTAGVAAFRQGRSLCLRLHGTLDQAMARAAAVIVGQDRDAVRLRLECSSLEAVEPDAARVLADVLLGWAAGGWSVDIHNLDAGIQRRIGWHPLLAFHDADELLFFDPARAPFWTDPASRH